MKTTPSKKHQAFTIIESCLMILALIVFSVILYSVVKKDYLTPPSPGSASETAPKAS